jgi:hypothetical protein
MPRVKTMYEREVRGTLALKLISIILLDDQRNTILFYRQILISSIMTGQSSTLQVNEYKESHI